MFALTMSATSAHAGAWLQPSGSGQIISTTDYATATLAFDDDRADDIAVAFEKIESRIYTEYGLIDRLTLFSQAGFQDVIFDGLEGKSRFVGPSAIRGGARVGLWQSGKHRLSASADLGYQKGGEFVTDGELDYRGLTSDLRVLYGYGWSRAFVDLQAGWLTRYGKGPDTWQLDATAGYDVTSRLSLSASAFARQTPDARLSNDVVSPTESVKLKAALLWDWSDKTRYEIGYIETVAGRNHVRDGGLTIGVWRRF